MTGASLPAERHTGADLLMQFAVLPPLTSRHSARMTTAFHSKL